MARRVSLSSVHTGELRDVPVGFSWTSLLFGPFVPLFRGDLKYFFGIVLGGFVFGILTYGIAALVLWIWQAFSYNQRYVRSLLEKGYKPAEESNRIILENYGVIFEQSGESNNDNRTQTEKNIGTMGLYVISFFVAVVVGSLVVRSLAYMMTGAWGGIHPLYALALYLLLGILLCRPFVTIFRKVFEVAESR